MMYDSAVLAHNFLNDLAFLTNNWSNSLGRPTVVVTFNSSILRGKQILSPLKADQARRAKFYLNL